MTVFFKTFGCRLNQAETARAAAVLIAAGWRIASNAADAKLFVIHSCAVTAAAEREGLRLLRQLRRAHPLATLVLAGCAAETESGRLAAEVDLRVPRDQKDSLGEFLLARFGVPSAAPTADPLTAIRTARAFLKAQDGCDFFCSYCIVPHTRGAPVSRPFDVCLDEARRLIDAGFREIVLTGCNIACYADTGRRLPELIDALATLPGLGRLRLGSIEPGTIEREIIALMVCRPTLCRSLHLPIQSGDDDVLRAMRRRYTAADLHATLEDAIRKLPDLGLGADVITGFPGETERAFETTRTLLNAHPFSNLHVFPYSERTGTPAATLPDPVPPLLRKARAHTLSALGAVKKTAFARSLLGRPTACLVERVDAAGQAHGWSDTYLACRFPVGTARRRDLVVFTPQSEQDGLLIG